MPHRKQGIVYIADNFIDLPDLPPDSVRRYDGYRDIYTGPDDPDEIEGSPYVRQPDSSGFTLPSHSRRTAAQGSFRNTGPGEPLGDSTAEVLERSQRQYYLRVMASAGSDNGSAVIFDLWGTLVPFDAALWADCEARIVHALGADSHAFKTEWHADYPARIVGTLEDSFRRVCSATGVLAEDAVIARAVQIRSDAHSQMFRPRDDAAATLRKLRHAGYRIGLITNCTSEIPQLWRASALRPLVDHAVFSCAAKARKPDAWIYRLALSGLDVDPSRCTYVGDGADRELEGAAAAGMRPIRLDAPDTDPPESWSGETVRSLADIPRLLGAA